MYHEIEFDATNIRAGFTNGVSAGIWAGAGHTGLGEVGAVF